MNNIFLNLDYKLSLIMACIDKLDVWREPLIEWFLDPGVLCERLPVLITSF